MLIVQEKLNSAEIRAQRAESELGQLSDLSQTIEDLRADTQQWQSKIMASQCCTCFGSPADGACADMQKMFCRKP